MVHQIHKKATGSPQTRELAEGSPELEATECPFFFPQASGGNR